MTPNAQQAAEAGFVFPGALAGRRVVLDPVAAVDRALFDALYGDPAVMAHVSEPLGGVRLVRAFDSALADTADARGRRRLWRIRCGGDGAAVGLLGLTRGGPGLEVGVLLCVGVQGRGLAADAIAAVARAVFAAPGVESLWARHRQDHRAAAGLMRALDFRPAAASASGAGWAVWILPRPAYPGRDGSDTVTARTGRDAGPWPGKAA